MIKQSYRKTRRGKFQKLVKEVYLSKEISCGLAECPTCEDPSSAMSFDAGEDKVVYILDEGTIFNQLDVVENCPLFKNVVILQTIVEALKTKKPNSYSNLKNLVDLEVYRKMYVFANEFSAFTHVNMQEGDTVETRNQRAVLSAAQWYTEHLKGAGATVLLITNSFSMHSKATQLGVSSETIFDFVEKHSEEFPSLSDYLGFVETDEGAKAMEIESGEASSSSNAIYAPHLDLDQIKDGIRKGHFFQGKLIIDRNNVFEGRATIAKYNIEILIKGAKSLNRALNGDLVAIELLPESEWSSKTFINIVEDEEQDNVDAGIKVGDDSVYKNILEKINKFDLRPSGKVIGVIKRNQRNYCGTVMEEDDRAMIEEKTANNGRSFELCTFVPVDTRYPPFLLRTKNPRALFGKKIMVGFNDWSIKSDKPLGHFIKVIGESGKMDTESKVILLEHNVETREFSKQVLACLPLEDDKWQIPEKELKSRLDLRDINVVSIDPPGCRDIDDALHCITLPNGNLEIGVHIADVSYFVKADSAIDLEAAHRCTTVYLVDRRTDMLPKLLTENLCSLRSKVDRLSFSVIWEITPEATIVRTKFAKTIINSRLSLTYEQAQKMIDDKSDKSEITESIRNLNKIARIIKQRRVDAGALSLASTQVKFSFDEETHNPTDVSFYKMFETNYLIEEYMLLANVAVAEKIVSHFPSVSILRKHSTPKPKQIRDFGRLLTKLGYEFDSSSSKALADSLDKIKKLKDPFFNKLVRILTTRTMNEANYFCTADADYPEFFHYGLACPLYTHFTSPIRRYADVLVHRLLAAAIDIESLPTTMSNKQKLTKICDKMNMRNRMARYASRASSDYHTYLFFKDRQNTEEDAIVTNIDPNGFSVILPQYGLEGFIAFSEQEREENENYYALKKFEKDFIMEFVLRGTEHKIFDHVWVTITVELKSFHKKITMKYVKKGVTS